MARLPLVGSDDGTWGQLLNDYLAVELDNNGNLKRGGEITAAGTKADAAVTAADSANAAATSATTKADAAAANANTASTLANTAKTAADAATATANTANAAANAATTAANAATTAANTATNAANTANTTATNAATAAANAATTANAAIPSAQRGQPNGVAGLDANGKVVAAQVPVSSINGLTGAVVLTAASVSADPAGTAQAISDGIPTQIANAIPTAVVAGLAGQKGVAGGIAALDANGQLVQAQRPTPNYRMLPSASETTAPMASYLSVDLVDTTNGAYTVPLPPPAANGLYVLKRYKGTNNLLVNPGNGVKIDNVSGAKTISDAAPVTLLGDGSNWWTV